MWINAEQPDLVFEGDRVAVAFLEEADAEEFLYLVHSSRESLDRWLPWVESVRSVESAENFLAAYQMQRELDNGGMMGVRVRESGALAGAVVLQWIDMKNRSAALGYFLGKEFEGMGLATEAVSLVLENIRNRGIHRVEILASTQNRKSCALAERLGFLKEGVSRDAEFLHGKWQDILRFAKIFEN